MSAKSSQYLNDTVKEKIKKWSVAKKIVFAALMGSLSAILQSAGGFLPGIGFFLSPVSTAAIFLASVFSLQYGVFSYLLTIMMLLFIEPGELFIFPFTTGLLGLSMGFGFCLLNKSYTITLVSGIALFAGLCIPLYGLSFSVFGPMMSSSFNVKSLFIIFIFSCLYSSIWIVICSFLLRKANSILSSKGY